ncbi:MAG: S8 family peptidase, partial [Clostridiales bacterium]
LTKSLIIVLIVFVLYGISFSFPIYANDSDVDSYNNLEHDEFDLNDMNLINQDELIVKYKEGVNDKEKEKIRDNDNLDVVSEVKNSTELLEIKKENQNINEVISNLEKNKKIEYVEPNYKRFLNYKVSDEYIENQWSIDNTNAKKAWKLIEKTENLKEVKVAVIDTGMNLNHEDLKGKISDDGYDYFDNDSNPENTDGTIHATHVAGIIAANSDNKIGISGLAGKAPVKIMPIRVLGYNNQSDEEYLSSIDFIIAKGIYHAADNNADIINMSLHSPALSNVLKDAVEYALDKGVIVIAAAGNNNNDTKLVQPCSIPGVISVSATDYQNEPAEFTNYGNEVDLAAPGVSILSTISGNEYKYLDGTSMASPATCALAAVIKSMHPEYTPNQVEDIMCKSSKDIGEKGKDEKFGYGLIDFYKALKTKPSKNKVSFRDNVSKERVFNNAELSVKFQEPENLNSMEIYIDNILVEKKTEVKNKAVIKFNVNTKDFKDGIKKVKVIAKDNNENKYTDYTKINIVNEVNNSVRVRITDDGYPIKYKTVFLYGKDKKKKDDEFDIKFSYLTDEDGYVDIPENVMKNISKNYVLCADDYEKMLPSSIYSFFNENSFGFVKEMNSYGVVLIDIKDFIHVNRDLLQGETSSETFGFLELKNGETFEKFPLILDKNEGFEDDSIKEPELLVPKDVYSTVLAAKTQEKDEENYYMINNKHVSLNQEDINIDFSKNNLSQMNFNYIDSDKNNNEEKRFILQYLNDLVILDFPYEKDGNNIVNVSPGEYIPNCSLMGINGTSVSVSQYSGETINVNDKLTKVNFGGDLKGHVGIDNTTYKRGSSITFKPDITDFFNNKLITALKIDFNNLISEELKNNLINKFKNLNNTDKFKDLILDNQEFSDSKSLLNFKIYDSKGNMVYETGHNYISDILPAEIPFDLKCGKYKGEITTTYPIDSSSEVFFRIE